MRPRSPVLILRSGPSVAAAPRAASGVWSSATYPAGDPPAAGARELNGRLDRTVELARSDFWMKGLGVTWLLRPLGQCQLAKRGVAAPQATNGLEIPGVFAASNRPGSSVTEPVAEESLPNLYKCWLTNRCERTHRAGRHGLWVWPALAVAASAPNLVRPFVSPSGSRRPWPSPRRPGGGGHS